MDGWSEEAFRLPILALIVSTVVETVIVAVFDLNHFRFAGELARAGGAFLSVLLLVSAFGRIAEWSSILDRVSVSHPSSKTIRDAFSRVKRGLMEWILIAMLISVAAGAISTFSEIYHEPIWARIVLTVCLGVANVFVAVAAYSMCRTRLYRAMAVLIRLDMQCQ